MPGPHQNWMALGAGGLYGGDAVGQGSPMPAAITELDLRRLGMAARTPSAEYPDGYLGDVKSRRDDRLLDSLKTRQNQRSYQRGVHKGERIDQSDYYWPMALQPNRGLKNQRRGKKTAPVEELAPPVQLVNDGKTGTMSKEPSRIDVRRKQQLARLMPTWS